MAEQLHQTQYPRRALTRREAAKYAGVSLKFLETPRGRELFPPVRISSRCVYFTDLLDQQINKLAIASGAMSGGQK